MGSILFSIGEQKSSALFFVHEQKIKTGKNARRLNILSQVHEYNKFRYLNLNTNITIII